MTVKMPKRIAVDTDGQQERFKQMYCFHNRSLLINEAVDQMDENKIDWAIIQCERTIETNLQKGE